ncbi:FUSC family protein [Paenibacillus sp. M1]|uniref:FUSC family protein n=1 Tax=Paenibacillus haidiansis TaxID=1574488 RepID=A0ABU7VPB6_9BACL
MDSIKKSNSMAAKGIKANTIPSAFKQAFQLQNKPFPYLKALRAAFVSAFPVVIGILFNHLDYGLLASLGGFTYLYVFNQPYAQRARRIFVIMLGLTLSVILGTLMAPYPLGAAVVMTFVGAVPVFIFGALRITGPSAIFFVLTYAMATGMPVDLSLAPLRGGLVFLGGALAWVVSMLGWFINPHKPELDAVKKVYSELAKLLDAVGTEKMNTARHRTVEALKEAENTLLAGYSSLTETDNFKRLLLLNELANDIFLQILEASFERKSKIPEELVDSMIIIANSIENKTAGDKSFPGPEEFNGELKDLCKSIDRAYALLDGSPDLYRKNIVISKPKLKTVLMGSYDKNSIVFLTALRTGIVIFFAAVVAISFDFPRSYWIPLSCAAVMAGSTFVGTFHRSIQRALGTVVGVLIASLILAHVHNGYTVALVIFALTFLTETFIVRSYGVAAMFFTPSALVMAEYSTQQFDFSYFASVRIVDIIVGSIIGLAGTVLIGRRLASNLLNHYIAKTLRSQGQYLVRLFSGNNGQISIDESKERRKMQTNTLNLLSVYSTALGELHINKEKLDSVWPVIYSIVQMGYFLDASLKYNERPVLADEDLSQLLYIFETMAMEFDSKQPLTIKNIPALEGFSKISNEIATLQNSVHLWSQIN